MATDDAAPRQGFLRGLLTDYRAFAGLVGLLVYGVVRVAYDAYYTRLGVFPEAVGLSETTILGRAALYLALTVSVTAIFGGLWLLAVTRLLGARASRRRLSVTTAPRLFAGSAILAVLAAVLVALGPGLRSLLGSYHLVFFCVIRCKFTVLTPKNYKDIADLVHGDNGAHAGYRFDDFGPAWLMAIPLVLLLAAAALGLTFHRRGHWTGSRRRPIVVFALLAAASFTAGLLAPHLIATALNAPKVKNPGLIDSHPLFVKWGVFVLVFGSVAAGLIATLGLLAGPAPRRSPWLIASFVAVLPMLLGFFSPTVPTFVEDEGGAAIAAAVTLWVALMAIGFWLWPHLRDRTVRTTAGLGFVVAVIVALTLFLAWERGLNLAQQAAMGDQISAKRFGLLSVRASVVCLDPTERGTRLNLHRHPYVYLGEASGTLVLYDYVADLVHELPVAFPLRMPSSSVTVRLAHFNPTGPHAAAWVNWDCLPNV